MLYLRTPVADEPAVLLLLDSAKVDLVVAGCATGVGRVAFDDLLPVNLAPCCCRCCGSCHCPAAFESPNVVVVVDVDIVADSDPSTCSACAVLWRFANWTSTFARKVKPTANGRAAVGSDSAREEHHAKLSRASCEVCSRIVIVVLALSIKDVDDDDDADADERASREAEERAQASRRASVAVMKTGR